MCLTPDIVKITTPEVRGVILLAADSRQEQCVCDHPSERGGADLRLY